MHGFVAPGNTRYVNNPAEALLKKAGHFDMVAD
jgi:hypothetical protein